MERGGRLKIRAAASPEDGTVVQDGRFVEVAVSDTGCGISTDHFDRIFEPFFTTKDIGRGTGLGLSQVYGFVHQSSGSVHVDSQVGQGTTLTLCLPLSSKPIAPDQGGAIQGTGAPERGNVLVVEDNVEVGEFATQLLHDLGYRTVLAHNADEALKLLDVTPEHFDLVLSDVVMPGLDGVALGREIRRRVPDLLVVLNSGYSHVLMATTALISSTSPIQSKSCRACCAGLWGVARKPGSARVPIPIRSIHERGRANRHGELTRRANQRQIDIIATIKKLEPEPVAGFFARLCPMVHSYRTLTNEPQSAARMAPVRTKWGCWQNRLPYRHTSTPTEPIS
jgi:CheY-like chemotaxis protein